MKRLLLDNKGLFLRMNQIEHVMMQKDNKVKAIFKILKKLLVKPEPVPKEPIGFSYLNKK